MVVGIMLLRDFLARSVGHNFCIYSLADGYDESNPVAKLDMLAFEGIPDDFQFLLYCPLLYFEPNDVHKINVYVEDIRYIISYRKGDDK